MQYIIYHYLFLLAARDWNLCIQNNISPLSYSWNVENVEKMKEPFHTFTLIVMSTEENLKDVSRCCLWTVAIPSAILNKEASGYKSCLLAPNLTVARKFQRGQYRVHQSVWIAPQFFTSTIRFRTVCQKVKGYTIDLLNGSWKRFQFEETVDKTCILKCSSSRANP